MVVPECHAALLGTDLSMILKSCTFFSPGRRCFKTLSCRQTNHFYQPPSQTVKWRGHSWISDQRILRYQVVLMEKPGLTGSHVRFLTQLPSCLPPRALSPFTLALNLWTTGQNPEGDCQKILWPILRKSGTRMEAALSWMEKEELDIQ